MEAEREQEKDRGGILVKPVLGPDVALRQVLGDVAMGRRECDLVFENALYPNLETRETYRAQIGIAQGYVAIVTQPGHNGRLKGKSFYDCEGRHAVPGLIDTHAHIESSMITPLNFARQVLPSGTTTVLADPHEICNCMGLAGMEWCIEASRGLPVDIFFAAPSCVPSVPGMETSHTEFGALEIKAMLQKERVIALGEVMDYMGVVNQSPRMMSILEAAREAGVLIQGHLSENSPEELAAYLVAGCQSDHETRGLKEAIMKLRAGLWLECRWSSCCHNMPVLAKALALCGHPENATMCTDDREPDDLLREGHIDEVIRQGILAGMPPIEAIRLASRNAARFLGLADRGVILPGRLANIALVDKLEEFRVREVFVRGELWAKDGALLRELPEAEARRIPRSSVILRKPLSREDYRISAPEGKPGVS
jgi:adenine deaminase